MEMQVVEQTDWILSRTARGRVPLCHQIRQNVSKTWGYSWQCTVSTGIGVVYSNKLSMILFFLLFVNNEYSCATSHHQTQNFLLPIPISQSTEMSDSILMRWIYVLYICANDFIQRRDAMSKYFTSYVFWWLFFFSVLSVTQSKEKKFHLLK